jgi:hypothetical protein
MLKLLYSYRINSSIVSPRKEQVLLFIGMWKNKKMKITPSKEETPHADQLPEHRRMKWKIDYVEDQGIIKAKTSGLMSADDKKKLCEEMLAAGRQKNVNAFLIDQKETSFGLSVLEIDRLPEMFRSIGFDIKDKIAVMVNSESSNKPLFNFLQNVFALSSLRLCVFTDSQEAIAWLKKRV